MRMIGKPVIKKYRKAPQAPKRFKNSYMFFSTVKHKEIRTELIANIKEEGQKIKTTDVAKLVSKAWKALPDDERKQWDEIARQDKARYEIEKVTYTGPWKVPIYAAMPQQQPPQTKHNKNNKKRHDQRQPPKRPLSAFLLFSNAKRSYVKNKYQDATHAEIPSILAQMWKDADPHEKQLFLDEQFTLEQQYNQTMLEWETSNSSSINSNININNSATTTTRTSEPLFLTTSMGTHSSAAYCTDMAATIFDGLSPYSSLSMNSSSAGTGTGAGAGTTGPLSSSTVYSGGYDPYNQGQQQDQYHHQQHHQQHQYQPPPQYAHYDHAAAYNYRNPYGETQHPSSSYGYHQLPVSAGFPVTNATATAANHTSSYEGGYDRRGSQQHAYEYQYNAQAPVPVHAPVTA